MKRSKPKLRPRLTAGPRPRLRPGSSPRPVPKASPKPGTRHEIITFKADPSLMAALRGVGNRSDFIRSALLAALANVCPLCKGSGTLTPDQRRHWNAFAASHTVDECRDCHALHLVCRRQPKPKVSVHA
jgi:hypothetical protein